MTTRSEATQAACPLDSKVMRQIANIAHHGGLIGLGDMHAAMVEIRKLTMPYWDIEECARLQREHDA